MDGQDGSNEGNIAMINKIFDYIQYRPRRSGAIVLAAIVFLMSVTLLPGFLRNGTLVIKTEGTDNTITITHEGEEIKTLTGAAKLRVPAGTYLATVSNHAYATKKIVTVVARKTNTYTIHLNRATEPEAVLPEGATSLLVSDTKLYYVNTNDHLLRVIDEKGIATTVSLSVHFDKIMWQDEHYGVGQEVGTKSLYSIRDGVIAQIVLPFTGTGILFSLTGKGDLVVSNGFDVYKLGSTGVFNKILSSQKQITSLATNNLSETFLRLKSSGRGNDGGVEVISNTGEKIAHREDFEAYDYSWSPDGKKLLATSDEGTTIYTNLLQKIDELPDANVSGISWLNNDTPLYSVGNKVYSYNMGSLLTSNITNTPISGSVSAIYPSLSGKSIYILALKDGASDAYSLYRVGLGGESKNTPDYYKMLNIYFPAKSDYCYLSYSNFLHPSLSIVGDQNICLNEAQSLFRTYDMPIEDFTVTLVGSLLGE